MAKPTMWKTLGAVLKGVIRGFLANFVSFLQIPVDWVMAALAYYFSGRTDNWGEFAEGLFYATIADVAEPFVGGVAAQFGVPGAAQAAPAAPAAVTQAAQGRAPNAFQQALAYAAT